MGIDGAEIKKRKLQKAMENPQPTDPQEECAPEIKAPAITSSRNKSDVSDPHDEKPNRNLINCNACGKEISKNAASCPHCGEPGNGSEQVIPKEKKERKGLGIVGWSLIILLIAWVYSLFFPGDTSTTRTKPSPPPKPKTEKELRLDLIGKCFSGWDGSHRELTNRIKKGMNDPDSYQHDETRYIDKGDHLVVVSSFRGKNAFGGVVKNSVVARTDLNCNVIEIVE